VDVRNRNNYYYYYPAQQQAKERSVAGARRPRPGAVGVT
jgi:hypothetical protein